MCTQTNTRRARERQREIRIDLAVILIYNVRIANASLLHCLQSFVWHNPIKGPIDVVCLLGNIIIIIPNIRIARNCRLEKGNTTIRRAVLHMRPTHILNENVHGFAM